MRLQASGKTSLMRRYVDDTFNHETMTTIGVDFTVKTLVVNGSTVKLQIWLGSAESVFLILMLWSSNNLLNAPSK